jgi:hypothetical protein
MVCRKDFKQPKLIEMKMLFQKLFQPIVATPCQQRFKAFPNSQKSWHSEKIDPLNVTPSFWGLGQ